MRESAQVSGSSNIWSRKTFQQRETLTIAGFAPRRLKNGTPPIWPAGRLIYADKIDHGFDKNRPTICASV